MVAQLLFFCSAAVCYGAVAAAVQLYVGGGGGVEKIVRSPSPILPFSVWGGNLRSISYFRITPLTILNVSISKRTPRTWPWVVS